MDIKLDEPAMQALMVKAVMDSLTPERRDEMISQALVYLVKQPEKGSYGTQQPSPLMTAFRYAAETVVNKIAREELENDGEFKKQLESLFSDVTKKLFADEVRETMVTKICELVVSGLKGDRY